MSPDSRWVTVIYPDDFVELWQLGSDPARVDTWSVRRQVVNQTNNVEFSPDGRWLGTVDANGKALLRDLHEPSEFHPLSGEAGNVTAVVFDGQGQALFVGNTQGEITQWPLDASQPWRSPLPAPGRMDAVISVAFSEDDDYLIAGGNRGVVHRWHLGEQDRYSSIYRPQDIHSMDMGSVLRVGYGHDGRLLTWEFDETGERVARELDLGHRGESLGRSAKEAGVSPAGATIRSAEVLLTWADDFKVFASSEGGNRINVWDLSTTVYHQSLQWLGRLPPPRTIEAVGQPAIVALALSPDGGSLATGHEDGSVRLLTLERARTVAEGTLLSGPDERISELQFSADGRQLAAAAADRMYLWETDTQALFDLGCRIAGRNMTSPEWTRYIGERSYDATCD